MIRIRSDFSRKISKSRYHSLPPQGGGDPSRNWRQKYSFIAFRIQYSISFLIPVRDIESTPSLNAVDTRIDTKIQM